MKIAYREKFDSIKNVELNEYKALIGFDVVLDHLVKVVKQKNEKGENELFSSISEFGSYLREKAGMSCCLELKTIQKKIGGNMALLSLAMSSLGVKTTCIGTAGSPEEPVYQQLEEKCDVYSIAPYGTCTALEFNDGKIMLAENETMQINWKNVEDELERAFMQKLVIQSDMICLVNWSEMMYANEIWRNMLSFLPEAHTSKKKKVFFDLADFSHRSDEDVLECVHLIQDYSACAETTLGLNENETRNMAKVLGIAFTDIYEVGKCIYEILGVDVLVIHTNMDAYAFSKNAQVVEGQAFTTKTPIALTGAGDNFNAGFCLGQLMELGVEACVLLGNASSGYYARYGKNTSWAGLKEFIQSYLEKEAG